MRSVKKDHIEKNQANRKHSQKKYIYIYVHIAKNHKKLNMNIKNNNNKVKKIWGIIVTQTLWPTSKGTSFIQVFTKEYKKIL